MQNIRDIAAEIVIREGGYVNDPDDPGGATNHGVTIGTLRRLGIDARLASLAAAAPTRAAELQGQRDRLVDPERYSVRRAHDLRIEDRPEERPGPGQVRLRLATGGVCGSDLHYYNHGGFGAIRLKEPMILGHEVSAFVDALGAGVTGLSLGQLVAVSPSRPCG